MLYLVPIMTPLSCGPSWQSHDTAAMALTWAFMTLPWRCYGMTMEPTGHATWMHCHGLPLHCHWASIICPFVELPWPCLEYRLAEDFQVLPMPDMALPWAVVFVGLDDTAMAMSRGSVMDCRDKAMGLATAW